MHMPPPLNIPQNTNPIPTALGMPEDGMMSPTSAGGTVRRAAPEPNKRALYVGGLDQRVTEEVLKQIFETTGHVQSVKIIPDKNVSSILSFSSSASCIEMHVNGSHGPMTALLALLRLFCVLPPHMFSRMYLSRTQFIHPVVCTKPVDDYGKVSSA